MKKKQIINQILNKVRDSELVYDQASKSVHSTVIQNELSTIRKKRSQYLRELLNAFSNRGNPIQYLDAIHKFTTRIWLMLNDLLIHRNVPNILITCVEADEELLKCYGKTKDFNLNEKVSKLITQQQLEIQTQTDDFKKRLKEYPWI